MGYGIRICEPLQTDLITTELNGYNTMPDNTVSSQWMTFLTNEIELHAGYPVTMVYQDEEGNVIWEAQVYSDIYGEEYHLAPVAITGYYFLAADGDMNGVYDSEYKTIICTYGRVRGGNIIVKYLDDSGNPLAPDTVLTGYYGDLFSTEKKAFAGYQFKEISGEAEGVYTTESRTIRYIYQKQGSGGNDSGRDTKVKVTRTSRTRAVNTSDQTAPFIWGILLFLSGTLLCLMVRKNSYRI